MLVLSRRKDESIHIGDDVILTVVEIRGDRVRLGIAAPVELPIHRDEVYRDIQRNRHPDPVYTSSVLRVSLQSWTDRATTLRRIAVAVGLPSDCPALPALLRSFHESGALMHDGFDNYQFSEAYR